MRCRGCWPTRRRIHVFVALAALTALAFGAAPRASAQPAFWGVGDLPGGTVTSSALAVSADGSVVVGGSESASGQEGFRWTGPGTLQGLGTLNASSGFYSVATGVSGNGAVIVGTSADGDSRAFRWSGGSMVGLGRFSCGFGCSANHALANAVSADGTTVVGSGAGASFFIPFVEAVRWPNSGTSISGLGQLSGGEDVGVAQGVSGNGAVIVGNADSSGGNRAFVWTSSTGMDPLPNLPSTQTNSSAMAVSADGSTIVGGANTSSTGTNRVEAVRWYGSGWTQVALLGTLPGASIPGSKAHATTSDGAIIVGEANDASGHSVAFVWDAVSGMQDLKQLLITDYGLPIEGWTLSSARGVSDPDGSGAFTIVGNGVNPQGDPEGFVAFLDPVACSDGVDNDSDGNADFPADSGCLSRSDPTEQLDCADGVDNDGDGDVDTADGECRDAGDPSEVPDCGDGFDDDGDGLVDFPLDPGCRDASGALENPACDNGLDDDGDGKVDFPLDLQCVAADDGTELADCEDGVDNDGDGYTDLADADCTKKKDPSEDPQCSDRQDNDADGRTDWPAAYPACASADDPLEEPQCSDGVDNDGDGDVDHPADAGCASPAAAREDPQTLAVGDVLVSDARGARLLALDPASGAFRSLASGLYLGEPQGVAQRASGEVVLADPGGLVEVDPTSGAQRRASGPLDAFQSLQVVFDGAGDAVVLEADRLSTVAWQFAAPGAKTTLLPVPSPDGNLGAFAGFSLAREAAGTLLVTGIGLPGSGIYRVDPGAGTATVVTPGFNPYDFRDLAVEASGQILAVGTVTGTGTGVFRVNPTSGALSVLSVDVAWTNPTGVAVAPGGDIWVADSGTCDAAGSCSGGEVVRVSPTSGARLAAWSDPLLEGQLDLAVTQVLPVCANGLDDDGDGLADFPDDPECRGPWHPSELRDCGNGLDDDGDGLVDLADPGCASATGKLENPACSDGIDNDYDNKVDYDGAGIADPDPQCTGPSLNKEYKTRNCGLGFELVALLPVLRRLARRRVQRA